MSALELRGLVKRYPGGGGVGDSARKGVSLTVDSGELVALYGPSGSGKTTLLLLAAGLLAPDEGSVSYGGRDLARLSPREAARHRRRDVGFVFQSPHLAPGASAVENAALKLLADGWTLTEACAAARPWLERAGMAEQADTDCERLSAGERQRVAIARALVGEPRLLLADEPTGALDSERGRQTLALLRELARERKAPTLIVTHDPQAVAFADRVHTLRDGRLHEGLAIDLDAVAAAAAP